VLGIRNKVYIITCTIAHHDCSVLINGVIYLQFDAKKFDVLDRAHGPHFISHQQCKG
jgi:hypothetical protein